MEAVTAAVKHVHAQLLGRTSGPKSDMTFSGTTACFVVSLGVRFAGSMEGGHNSSGGRAGRLSGGKRAHRLVVGSVGDSAAVLVRAADGIATPLTVGPCKHCSPRHRRAV